LIGVLVEKVFGIGFKKLSIGFYRQPNGVTRVG